MPRDAHTATEMLITDLEAAQGGLRSAFDIQLLELMGRGTRARLDRQGARTSILEERSQTKLYHHINLLNQRGFISVAETRIVSGRKRGEADTRVNALSFRADRNLLHRGLRPRKHYRSTCSTRSSRRPATRSWPAAALGSARSPVKGISNGAGRRM